MGSNSTIMVHIYGHVKFKVWAHLWSVIFRVWAHLWESKFRGPHKHGSGTLLATHIFIRCMVYFALLKKQKNTITQYMDFHIFGFYKHSHMYFIQTECRGLYPDHRFCCPSEKCNAFIDLLKPVIQRYISLLSTFGKGLHTNRYIVVTIIHFVTIQKNAMLTLIC